MLKITPYQDSHRPSVLKFMEDLQDYLVKIDPQKRLLRLPGYGEAYTDDLLRRISTEGGIILIAELEGTPVGMIAGVLEKTTIIDQLDSVPEKAARILELIVTEGHRGQHIGEELMKALETHFKSQGCDLIRVEVFEPNHPAHHFYNKLGYTDRMIRLVKKI